ncbi:MAG: quinone-dependent dihydroorotate dehydrogenase [Candidatus Dojkabacteria bacterium]|nr:MAG: quinone-dependent dihydroorotate dehydrogenase [Candidatus Dojkabacteria bacterium]
MLRAIFRFLYKTLLKPILFLFDPETDHDLFTKIGEFFGKYSLSRKVVRAIYGYHGPDISKTVDGIHYRTPILLSAGFDYNGRLPAILPSLGFGGAEIGSVTLRPCEGNEKPRLGRALKSKSLIVWKGLRNDGVDTIISRINSKKQQIPEDFVLGISIARTNDQQTATLDEGIADYCGSYQKLVTANVGDYYTINISCPNAFGGETFAEKSRLDALLSKLSVIRDSKPLYIKFPINPPWEEIKELLDVCIRHQVQGVIIGNLNKNYDDLDYREEAPAEFRGGLSGKPCRVLSTELIRKTREYVGKSLTIIGVGGILTPQDAHEKIDAGADLVMLITGMIMEGPHLISDIADSLALRNKV